MLNKKIVWALKFRRLKSGLKFCAFSGFLADEFKECMILYGGNF